MAALAASAVWLIALATRGDAATESTPSPARVEHCFQWGLYDSLIAELEPTATAGFGADTPDSIVTRYLLYLGVAYSSVGRIGEAREFFARAGSRQPGIALDEQYVSRETSELFRATLADLERRRVEGARQDSLLKVRDEALRKTVERLRADEARKSRQRGVAATVTSGGFAVLCAALAAYEYHTAAGEYAVFKRAASTGDLMTYARARKAVDRADALTISFSGTSALLSAAGTYFCVRTMRPRRPTAVPGTPGTNAPDTSIPGPGPAASP